MPNQTPSVKPRRIPKMGLHKATGQARVIIEGNEIYLGKHGTPEAQEKYNRSIAEWLSDGTIPDKSPTQTGQLNGLTVSQILKRFWPYAQSHYQKNGEPTSEVDNYRQVVRLLRDLYGMTPAEEFGPKKLKIVREEMIRKGWVRTQINKRVGRIIRIFKWAAEEELIGPVWRNLESVKGLQQGRSEAKESEKVRPVEWTKVEQTLSCLSSIVADMVRVQYLCGCRPGEVCQIRRCDIEMDHERNGTTLWLYRPEFHKTQHLDLEKRIWLGPEAQSILKPYLVNRPADTYCFSPQDAQQERKEKLRENRKTKVQPSQRDRSKPNPQRQAKDSYNKDSYGRAIKRACEIAFDMPKELRNISKNASEEEKAELQKLASEWRKRHAWTPNQLRHAKATEIREQFGVELASDVLGHADVDTTLIYAEKRDGRVMEIMAKCG